MRVRLGKVRAYAAVAASVLLALAIVTQRRSAAAAADRLTLIAVWSGAKYQPYFRHLIASARLNADAADLLIINRMDEDAGSGASECLDLAAHGIDLSQDTNIRLHCMSDIDWKVRHIDFLCSARYGWDCNDEERDGVAKAMMGSKDRLNCEWKPFRGYIFRDLFLRPENPLWAWVDLVRRGREAVGARTLTDLHRTCTLAGSLPTHLPPFAAQRSSLASTQHPSVSSWPANSPPSIWTIPPSPRPGSRSTTSAHHNALRGDDGTRAPATRATGVVLSWVQTM